MDMKGEQRIPAPITVVWESLNDPDVLKQCIPGCQSLEMSDGNVFTATVQAKVGPVKAKFSGEVQLSEIDPPNGYVISGEGKGGAAGFAKGGAKVSLAEDGAETVLTYEVDASVGGKLAQIGSRLIDSTAKKMANDFFDTFVAIVTEKSAGGAAPAAPVEAEAAAPVADTAPSPVAEPAPEAPAAAPVAEPASEPEPTPAETPAAAAIKAADEVAETRKGLSPWVWAGALVVVAGILILAFGG